MKFKTVIIILLLILLVVFALQNAEIVKINLLFWSVQTPGVLLILVCIAIGVIIGMILGNRSVKAPPKETNTEIRSDTPIV
jgi:lipopolysaccharide assembly protein A